MGPVEEIRVPFGGENDEIVDKAANANFDHDRELDPIRSNPNSTNNIKNLTKRKYLAGL